MHQLCLSNICCYLFSYFGFFLSARVGARLLSVWIIVVQEPTVLAVDASRGCSDNFPFRLSFFYSFSRSLEDASTDLNTVSKTR